MLLQFVDPYDIGLTTVTGESTFVGKQTTAEELIDTYPVSEGYIDLPTDHALSSFFDYGELTYSDTAIRLGLDNRVPENQTDIIERASYLANQIMDPLRASFGPYRPNSWFRGQPLEYALTGQKGFVTWINKSYRPTDESEPSADLVKSYIKACHTLVSLQNSKAGKVGHVAYGLWLKYYSLKQHPKGEAVDLSVRKAGTTKQLRDWLLNLDNPYDQIILESYKPAEPNSGWVHYSIIDEQADKERKNRYMNFELANG